ncbi:Predicted fumarylpyruvate hydrolase protein [Candidatus Terasakiella magnetica]|uniref:Predicted fumarylpyruvate hydrolase protein n=1 Tax=Candidatus Terasakiella magnetica TaxID=1867952 RepID=A0A1C3RIV2_9PROT|nr:fumarylacetoacetate hydrolase family protein [Candidatus Terasakiella magnetica]SCA57203.1 Predicted fumarylpyruvate hydrolase protein [Candidatus Terasakiella magnetica]
MQYVVPLWTPPALHVKDSEAQFPIRRVHCVAKNYGAHIREMGGDPNKVKPKFFSKSAHAVSAGVDEVSIAYPRATQDLHHEVELVVALGENAKIFGFGIGIDFTKRDLQAVAKENGMPWDTSKNFTGGAAVSQIIPIEETGELTTGAISLSVNGEMRQQGDLAQMIYNVREIMDHLDGYDELLAGDIIFTGTPAGVGAVEKGDEMSCKIEGLPDFTVRLV